MRLRLIGKTFQYKDIIKKAGGYYQKLPKDSLWGDGKTHIWTIHATNWKTIAHLCMDVTALPIKD